MENGKRKTRDFFYSAICHLVNGLDEELDVKLDEELDVKRTGS